MMLLCAVWISAGLTCAIVRLSGFLPFALHSRGDGFATRSRQSPVDLIFSDHFSRNEPGIFESLRGALPTHGDAYMHLADRKADGAVRSFL
jgi:hypothetical protein